MGKPVQINFPVAAAAALGALQAPVSGVPLVLGATAVQASALSDINRVLTLTSGGNLSGINFTFAGTDTSGNAVSETIAGPSGNTVSTTNAYHKVTITPSGSSATTVSVGTGATGSTRWVQDNLHVSPFNLTVAVGVTGTINYTVQDTPDDVNAVASPLTFDHPSLAALTAKGESNYAFPVRAVRCVINSSSAGATLAFYAIQAGIAGA